MRFESETEQRKLSSSASLRKERKLFQEILDTDFAGYVYHPNLVWLDAHLENGLKQSQEKFPPTLSGRTKNSLLHNFRILSNFLRQKPYAFSLSAQRSRQVENREFFERQIINSTRYDGDFGLRNDILPLGFYLSDSTQSIDRQSRPSQDYHDRQLRMTSSHESQLSGQSKFTASQDSFRRSESGTAGQKGTAREFEISNQKLFSVDKKKILYSSGYFYGLSGTSKSSIVNLQENYTLEHNDALSSAYNWRLAERTSAGKRSRDNRVVLSARHRLYESLVSGLAVNFSQSKGNTFSQQLYGAALDEDYSKKLGRIGRFVLGLSFSYAEEKRDAPLNVISVIDEPHMLTDGTPTYLDQTGEVTFSSVVVTDTSGTSTYTFNLDYQLSAVSGRTQMQRLSNSSITNGQEVLVDYQVASSPTFKFNTLLDSYRFRMDFLEGLVGIYYRLAKERHPRASGEDNTVLQKVSDAVSGIDFHYGNLAVEFTYQDYDSNLAPYRQERLKESYLHIFSARAALTLESSQTQLRQDTQARQRFFEFIFRYSLGITRDSRLNWEMGFRKQGGGVSDINDTIGSLLYEVTRGKFLLDFRYDFKRMLYIGDRLVNHFFSTKIKRRF